MSALAGVSSMLFGILVNRHPHERRPWHHPSALPPRRRLLLILATLLALFLSALDTLIMSAAMPTIVADLGGLHLYSWVFSTYLLSRAVALRCSASWPTCFPTAPFI